MAAKPISSGLQCRSHIKKSSIRSLTSGVNQKRRLSVGMQPLSASNVGTTTWISAEYFDHTGIYPRVHGFFHDAERSRGCATRLPTGWGSKDLFQVEFELRAASGRESRMRKLTLGIRFSSLLSSAFFQIAYQFDVEPRKNPGLPNGGDF
jgi:hypothetical protein